MGLGYIGLSTAVMFARHGMFVHGVDTDAEKINILKNNELPIHEQGVKEMLDEALKNGRLTVSVQPDEADVFIIAVPTPINPDRSADLVYVKSVAEMILPFLRKGSLVILESTVPPGTLNNLLIPILKKSNLVIGEELFVSHSPERVLPGRIIEELVSNDRIVGGINEKSTELTVNLYSRFVKGKIHTADAATAEFVKLIENTYRDINIAFANELALIAGKLGINVWKAIELANHHPRVNIHLPGPGVGGHCIAVDPWFIVEKAPDEARLISLTRNINDGVPRHIADTIEKIVKEIDSPVITLLGLAFKGNVDDIRESPSLAVMSELKGRGYIIKAYDPYVRQHMDGKADTIEEAACGSDCLVVLTDHNLFKYMDYSKIGSLLRTRIIYDTRNLLSCLELSKQGFRYILMGS